MQYDWPTRKQKVVTSQKSFSGSGSQTLFSAELVTEKIRMRSQAINSEDIDDFTDIKFVS